MDKKAKIRRREDKERILASGSYQDVRREYLKNFQNVAFACFGTALTLFRDGVFNDTDFDFAVYEDKYDELVDIIKKNKYKVIGVTRHKGVITEIKLKIKNINVDFFRVQYENGEYVNYELWENFMRIHKIYKWYVWGNQKLEFKLIDGFKVPTSKDFYRNQYGTTWNIPIKYSEDYINSEEYKKNIKMELITDKKYIKKNCAFSFKLK